MIIENTNIEPVPTDSGQDLFAMPVEQVEEIETINIEDHPIHGDFKVEVPKGWEDAQVKEYVGALDLDLLLGLPQREDDKDLGVTDVKKIKEFENAVGSGFREGRWYAHDSLEGGTQSIAFGRKLTKAEEKLGFINIDGKDVDYRQGITPKQAEALFVESTNSAKRVAMASLVKVGLEDDNSKVQALTSLVYNVGPSAWGKSKAKAFLEAGNVEDFLHEAFDSKVGFVRINGEISRGLVRRRGDEARLFASEDVVKEGGFGNMIRETLKAIGGAINPIGSAEAHTFDPTQAQGGAVPLGNNNYKVASGDTLAGIAKKFGTTVEQLIDLNSDITDATKDKIAVGQEILLMPPGGVPATPEPKPVRSTPTTTATFNTDTGVFDLFDAEPAQTVETSGSSSIPESPSSVIALATPPRKPKGLEDVTPPTVSAKQPVPAAVLPKGKPVEMADAMIEETLLGNPSEVESQLSFFVGDHASIAIQHIMIGMKEKLGLTITDEDRAPITEKSVSPQILDVIKIATYKAWKEKRTTNYQKDYGNAAKLVYGNLRGSTGDVLKTAISTFFDPVAAAGLTIGESSGLRVDKRGHLVLENDEYNFPEIGGKKSDAWLVLQRLFSDKSGFFGVRDKKNRIKINFDFGPVKDVEAFVRDLEGKKKAKPKTKSEEARSPLEL